MNRRNVEYQGKLRREIGFFKFLGIMKDFGTKICGVEISLILEFWKNAKFLKWIYCIIFIYVYLFKNTVYIIIGER